MSEYRTYINEDGEEKYFTVFIIHGHSDTWRNVERFINHSLNFKTVVLIEDNIPGKIIIDDLEENIEDCECAVAIMSKDDKIADNKYISRQNVLFEIGYCIGVFEEREDLVILKEKSVEINSDLYGLIYIPYSEDNIDSTFHKLAERLEEIYEDYCDEDE
ncbi:MAG: nucleotide-binding protein [Bacteroidia bacterium]|nr:nucleotide-binding protein [Bacteroidia bacterium]